MHPALSTQITSATERWKNRTRRRSTEYIPPSVITGKSKCTNPNLNHPQFNQLLLVVFTYSTHFTTFWVILLTNRQTKTQHKSKHYPCQDVADAIMKETEFARNKPAADCMHKHYSLLPHCLQTDNQWHLFYFLKKTHQLFNFATCRCNFIGLHFSMTASRYKWSK